MNMAIGQTIYADPETWQRRAVHMTAGHPRWHGLMVRPQREAAAVAWLELRGVYSFYPVTYRTTMQRGKKVEHESRYLPGYVFARFPARAINARVLDGPFIHDALRMQSGHWGVIRPNDIRKLHAMRSRDALMDAKKAEAARIKVGDKVRVMDGLWEEGQEVEIIEVRAGKAKFRVHMFGAEVPAEASIDQLRKIG